MIRQRYPDDAVDETLHENEWLSLKRLRVPSAQVGGYVYSHETRCNGRIVAALPFRIARPPKGADFLLRVEVTPCWGVEPVASAVTGGVDDDENCVDAILRELREETGFAVPPARLIDLGAVRGSKSTDTVYSLYAAPVDELEQYDLIGDGSPLEDRASVRWTEHPWESDDPLCGLMWARLVQSREWALRSTE